MKPRRSRSSSRRLDRRGGGLDVVVGRDELRPRDPAGPSTRPSAPRRASRRCPALTTRGARRLRSYWTCVCPQTTIGAPPQASSTSSVGVIRVRISSSAAASRGRTTSPRLSRSTVRVVGHERSRVGCSAAVRRSAGQPVSSRSAFPRTKIAPALRAAPAPPRASARRRRRLRRRSTSALERGSARTASARAVAVHVVQGGE